MNIRFEFRCSKCLKIFEIYASSLKVIHNIKCPFCNSSDIIKLTGVKR